MTGSLADLREFYRYLGATRKGYLDVFQKLPWEAMTRDRGASHPSIRDVFVHTMDAHRQWFACILDVPGGEAFDPNAYGSVKKLRALESEIDALVTGVLEGLRDGDLARKHKREDGREYATRTILLHMIEEELQHRGEINALLWQDDVDAPVVGYDDWLEAQGDASPK